MLAERPSAEVLLEGLLEDDDLERLEYLAQRFNIFEVLGTIHQEAAHSNFLAWLLNPSGSHALGDYFLKRFLWKTASLVPRDTATVTPLDIDGLHLGDVDVRREWRSIDILLICDSERFLCAIENKVGSSEHGDQLIRYARTCGIEFAGYRGHFIYLSPAGDKPSDQNWIPISYQTIRDLIESITEAKQSSLGQDVIAFLRQYCDSLGRHVVGDSVADLCRRIYLKHKAALDLLFEYRPDTQLQIREILEKMISEDDDFEVTDPAKAYFHFAPRAWNAPILVSDANKTGRIVDLMFQNRLTDLTLYVEIQPGNEQIRGRLFAAVQGCPPFKPQKTLYPQYSRIYRRDILRKADFDQLDVDGIEQKIRNEFQKFKDGDFKQINAVIRAAAV